MADARVVAITGSTGLIGERLVTRLREEGHVVRRVVRSREQARGESICWSVDRQEIDARDLEGVDAVVHLAGAPIGAQRWTPEVKQEIMRSRSAGTDLLARTLAQLDDGPDRLVSGSAVGFYGSRDDEVLTEGSRRGEGFLADVTVAWEQATEPAEEAGISVAHARTGIVLASGAPLIDKVELPFKLGVGGVIGDGSQWIPWISVRDEVRALQFLVEHPEVTGPVNVCQPSPVTNRELTKAIGAALGRPTFIPTPTFGIRLLYGEMGVTLATASQRCLPETLEEAGFEWQDTSLQATLERAFS